MCCRGILRRVGIGKRTRENATQYLRIGNLCQHDAKREDLLNMEETIYGRLGSNPSTRAKMSNFFEVKSSGVGRFSTSAAPKFNRVVR